jgi:hypothetical protein
MDAYSLFRRRADRWRAHDRHGRRHRSQARWCSPPRRSAVVAPTGFALLLLARRGGCALAICGGLARLRAHATRRGRASGTVGVISGTPWPSGQRAVAHRRGARLALDLRVNQRRLCRLALALPYVVESREPAPTARCRRHDLLTAGLVALVASCCGRGRGWDAASAWGSGSACSRPSRRSSWQAQPMIDLALFARAVQRHLARGGADVGRTGPADYLPVFAGGALGWHPRRSA